MIQVELRINACRRSKIHEDKYYNVTLLNISSKGGILLRSQYKKKGEISKSVVIHKSSREGMSQYVTGSDDKTYRPEP